MTRFVPRLRFAALVALFWRASLLNAQSTAEPRSSIPDEPLDDTAVRIPDEEFETLPERPRRKFSDRPIQIGTRMGFGTTVGLIGLLGEYNVDDMLALGGGIGVNGWGPIWGIHARIRPLIGASNQGRRLHALTLEGAFSQGNYALTPDQYSMMPSMRPCEKGGDTSGCATQALARWVSWAQFELGWETRAPGGFTLLLSSGFATRLNSPNWQCTMLDEPVSCGSSTPPRVQGTFSISMGHAF